MPNLSTVMSKHSGRKTDLTWTEDSERNAEARSASGGAVRSPTAYSLSGENAAGSDSRVRLNDNTESDGDSTTRRNPVDDEKFRMPHSAREAARESRAETTEGSSGHDAFGSRDVRLSVHDTKRRLHDYAEDERVHGDDAGANLRDSGSKGSGLWKGEKSGKSISESDDSSGAGRGGRSSDADRSDDADRRSSFNIRARRSSTMDDDFPRMDEDNDNDNEKPTLRERAAGAVEGMRQYFHDIKENVGEKVDDAKEKLSEMKDDAKDKAEDLRESASEKYENAKDSVNKSARDAKDKAADAKDRAGEKADRLERQAERKVEDAKDSLNKSASRARDAARSEDDKEHPQLDAGAGKIRPFASNYKSDHNAPTQADLKPTGRTPATPATNTTTTRRGGAARDESDDSDARRNEGETLSQKAQNAKETIKDKAAELKEKAVEAKDNLKDKMRSTKDDADDKIDDAKDKAQEMKRDAKSKARETERDAKDKAADLKEDAKDKAQEMKSKAKEASRGAQRRGGEDKDEDEGDDEKSAEEKDGKSKQDRKGEKDEETLDDMVFENTPDSIEGGADVPAPAVGDAMNRGSGNEHLIRDYMRSSRHDHVDDDMEGVKQVAREMADTEDGRTNENVRRVSRSPIRGEEGEVLGPFARLRRFFRRDRSRSADRDAERKGERGVDMPPRRSASKDRDADRDRDTTTPRRNVDINMTSPAVRPGIGEVERGELGGTFTPMDRTFTPIRDSRSADRDAADREVITVTAEESGRQADAAVNAPTPSPMDVSRSEEGIADLTDLSDPLAEAGAMLERGAAQMLQRRRAGSGAASMA